MSKAIRNLVYDDGISKIYEVTFISARTGRPVTQYEISELRVDRNVDQMYEIRGASFDSLEDAKARIKGEFPLEGDDLRFNLEEGTWWREGREWDIHHNE